MQKSITPENGLSRGIVIFVGFVLAAVGGLLALMVAQPLIQAVQSLLGLDTQEGMWYVTRAAGLAAYLVLWLSTVWGLAVASKIFDPLLHRAFTFDAHEFLSLLAIGFVALHVGVLLIDSYMPYSLVEILVPFVAPYRALWVGLGVIGMYLTLLVTVTFYLRTRIGYKTFRSLHLFSFLAYVLVTLHSVFAGTDSSLLSAKLVYIGTAFVVAVLTMHWWLGRRSKKASIARAI
jgi:predicted ferric reductase